MIRVKITDADAIKSLKYENVKRYLIDHGWKIEVMQEYGCRWSNPDYDDILLVALDIAGDYGRRLNHAIELISELEKRSELDIFTEMGGDLGITV